MTLQKAVWMSKWSTFKLSLRGECEWCEVVGSVIGEYTLSGLKSRPLV
jgi:hypothetical protein